MCGRFNVIGDPLSQIVSEQLGIKFSAQNNPDLCPSQQVSTLVKLANDQPELKIGQYNTTWGIKPDWSKKLLINAQAETVTRKSTFKDIFEYQRCLVPCNGWFEWRKEGERKVKYHFSHNQGEPLYMAGMIFLNEKTELVTLTTTANENCINYHRRMPFLVAPSEIGFFLNANSDQLKPLLNKAMPENIKVEQAAIAHK